MCRWLLQLGKAGAGWSPHEQVNDNWERGTGPCRMGRCRFEVLQERVNLECGS